MPRAIWNGHVVAETETFEEVEGNVYFPQKSIDCAFFKPARKTTECGWKGTAFYYDLVSDGTRAEAAAWYYPEPKPAAGKIKDFIAFSRAVTVER